MLLYVRLCSVVSIHWVTTSSSLSFSYYTCICLRFNYSLSSSPVKRKRNAFRSLSFFCSAPLRMHVFPPDSSFFFFRSLFFAAAAIHSRFTFPRSCREKKFEHFKYLHIFFSDSAPRHKWTNWANSTATTFGFQIYWLLHFTRCYSCTSSNSSYSFLYSQDIYSRIS